MITPLCFQKTTMLPFSPLRTCPPACCALTSYVYNVKPRSEELLVDEMLAIADQINTWREKKASEEAQWRYSMWLNSDERGD